MTDETVSDLSYADTLWKAADALRGQVDAAEYKHVQAGREKDECRMKKEDDHLRQSSSFFIPTSHFSKAGRKNDEGRKGSQR